MAKTLKVLFISSEVEPFAKTGGLADVSGALPQTIKQFDHEIRIMLPRYGSIKSYKEKLHDMVRLRDIEVPVGEKQFPANVKSSFITNNHQKVQVYFLDNPELFGRGGLYVNPDTKRDYHDNDVRFIFFCRGILEVLKKMSWQPDVIHCNDWHTGLVPVYLRTLYLGDPFYKATKTVFTVHNLAYQGIFPKSSFARTLLPSELFSENGVAANGNVNFMKAGILFADAVTTVSRRYAEEISSSEEFGCGLTDVVNKRRRDLHGILNGIDYAVWNPATDELIPHRYTFKSIDTKVENKKALLAKMKLPFQENVPLIGMISRLAEQKGFDLISEIIDRMMKLDIQLVLLGTGEKRYHELFEKASKKYPQRIAIQLSFNNELAHWIEAGSDIFLMPSRYEPCGLNQMYSLRYGTVPIVRATGGLDDTIQDFDSATGAGTGFKFQKYNSEELWKTIRRAVQLFADRATWKKLIKNGMNQDYSWETSAKQYIQLYRSITRK